MNTSLLHNMTNSEVVRFFDNTQASLSDLELDLLRRLREAIDRDAEDVDDTALGVASMGTVHG